MSERALNCIKAFKHSIIDLLKKVNIDGVGSNVTASRQEKAWPEEESFVIVNIPSVNFEDKSTNPRFYFATADLNVDVYARAFIDGEDDELGLNSACALDDFLDDTAEAIVKAIDPCSDVKGPFNGLVTKCALKSFSNNLSEKGETDRGAVRIVFGFSFTVHVDKTAPTDDFLRAENTLTVGEGNANSQVFDTNVRPVL